MVKKRVIPVILILCLVLSCMPVFANDDKTFILTDIATGNVYTVCEKDRETLFILNSETAGMVFVTDFDACTVYNGVFTLYTVDSLNKAFNVNRYDSNKETVISFSVNEDPYYNDLCFAEDYAGNVYFVSAKDTTKLCVYKEGAVESFDINSQIKQLMYLGNNEILIAATDKIFIYRNGETEVILNSALTVPLSYSDGIFTDKNGKSFAYKNEIFNEDDVTKATYISEASTSAGIIYEDIFIADKGTTVNQIKKSLGYPEFSKITKADGKNIENGKAGTGTSFTLSTGEVITVIIYGELTGEGNINSRDTKAILNHLSEKEPLTGDFLTAADVDKDGNITTKDALMLALMIE